MFKQDPVIIALGGNAISSEVDSPSIEEQFEKTRQSVEFIAELIISGFRRILITHGNGPQVGNVILRNEMSAKFVRPNPIDVCVSDTQGQIGYMLQQLLKNALAFRGVTKDVSALVTQVLVDPKDPAFQNPTKPVGMFYKKDEATKLTRERGWNIKEDAGRGYRRVVPSPKPIEIIERMMIKKLMDAGVIMIGVGGGGIPVVRQDNGVLVGVEAVIDKDLASSLVANEIGAKLFIMLTSIDHVMINFNKPDQKKLKTVKLSEIKKYLNSGEFAEGSMAPKIQASIDFLEKGGEKVVITKPENLMEAVFSEYGTHIVG